MIVTSKEPCYYQSAKGQREGFMRYIGQVLSVNDSGMFARIMVVVEDAETGMMGQFPPEAVTVKKQDPLDSTLQNKH